MVRKATEGWCWIVPPSLPFTCGSLATNGCPVAFGFLRRLDAEVVPFNEEHLDAALAAFIRFGRGRHPAALNFGDCMSYAVASVSGMPLLFTGEDFSRTDIAQA